MLGLIILGHPDPASFNHAIALTAQDELEALGYTVVLHDLYAEKFDPLITPDEIPEGAPLSPMVRRHCNELAAADLIVVVHPNWWGQPPAILKGWVDRVMRVGVAYRFLDGDTGEGIPIGLLGARMALLFTTSNTPRDREQTVFGDPLEGLWKTCIMDFCGVTEFIRRNFEVICVSTAEQRQVWLDEVRNRIRTASEGCLTSDG